MKEERIESKEVFKRPTSKKKKIMKPEPCSDKTNDSSCDEEWVDSGDSLDDVVIGELEDPEEVIVGPIIKPKVGDFILAKFLLAGKKSQRVTEFKYVAEILRQISDTEFEIHCLKNIDTKKTQFMYIENYVSLIVIANIIGSLPEPTLKEEGRMLVNVFPGAVETVEKY